MKQATLVWAISVVVQCRSESTSDDNSIVQGIAKIGFPPTVLKVFIKGDIQAEEIERLLNLCTIQDKLPLNDSDLTRNRRNSISDYIGKLYSFNNLFRPYRRSKQLQTTKTPWLKKFLRGVQAESKTESFWGMALGAHTFSPFARPLAQTKMPHHRIRNQQRIDKLLGITRNYEKDERNPYEWIKNQEKFDHILGLAKVEKSTTAITEQTSTRTAFHKAPLDVAGLKNVTFFPHPHTKTTPKRLRFCEKQCADEPEDERSRRPGSSTANSDIGKQATASQFEGTTLVEECKCTTEEYTCTAPCDADYLDKIGADRKKYKDSTDTEPGSAVTKHVAQTKITTSKYTRSKERSTSGPVWTLPTNSVLDQAKTQEERKTLPQTKASNGDRTEHINKIGTTTAHLLQTSTGMIQGLTKDVSSVTGEPQKTCIHGKPTKQMKCLPLPIPTRIKIPLCPITRKSTKLCSRKTTTPVQSASAEVECDCQTGKPPLEEAPISVGDSLETTHKKPNDCKKGKPQKIIVRISSALGEVPVVIMRDNGVSGVSLSLVNDYLLDENNILIKCLGQKPLRGRTSQHDSQNDIARLAPHSKKYRNRNFLPHVIRHQLHGLQPKRYSFKINYGPSQRLVSGPRASFQNAPLQAGFPNPSFPHDVFSAGAGISNTFPSYKFNPPNSQMRDLGSLGFQYPPIQNPRNYQLFKTGPAESPASSRLNQVALPIPQMNSGGFPGNRISQTDYPRFKIHPGLIGPDGMSLPGFEPSELNLQPPFPQKTSDTSQLMGYRSPFLPLFYPNKNVVQSPKYILRSVL